MNKKTFIPGVLVLVLLSANCLEAGSIWARKDKHVKELYADDKARHIGDILTITITEDSIIENKGKRTLSKKTARSVDFGGGPNFTESKHLNKILPEPLIPAFNLSGTSNNTLDSKADYKDERSFIDSITVVIVDIMPNNNLVIMGTRNRDLAGDIQIIEVSGIVRPSDISFSNTVQSDRVANFHIVSRNKGVADPFTRPGWLGKFLNIVWPF